MGDEDDDYLMFGRSPRDFEGLMKHLERKATIPFNQLAPQDANVIDMTYLEKVYRPPMRSSRVLAYHGRMGKSSEPAREIEFEEWHK